MIGLPREAIGPPGPIASRGEWVRKSISMKTLSNLWSGHFAPPPPPPLYFVKEAVSS